MWRILNKKGAFSVVLLCPLYLYYLRYLTLILFLSQNRVIIKVDRGLGRANIDILAYIHALGIYCVPGVSNTTLMCPKRQIKIMVCSSQSFART